MRMNYTYYEASKNGKALRIPGVPDDVEDGVIKAYRDAGYIIARITEEWDTEGRVVG